MARRKVNIGRYVPAISLSMILASLSFYTYGTLKEGVKSSVSETEEVESGEVITESEHKGEHKAIDLNKNLKLGKVIDAIEEDETDALDEEAYIEETEIEDEALEEMASEEELIENQELEEIEEVLEIEDEMQQLLKREDLVLKEKVNVSGYIVVDGNLKDWDKVPKVCEKDGIILKAMQDDENIYVCIQGEGKNTQVFIDSNQSEKTGYLLEDFPQNGTDYMVEGTSIYRYVGTGEDWNFEYIGEVKTSALEQEENVGFVEMVIPKKMVDVKENFEMGVGINDKIFLSPYEGWMFNPYVILDFDASLLEEPKVTEVVTAMEGVTFTLKGISEAYIVEFEGEEHIVKHNVEVEKNASLTIKGLTPGDTYSYRVCSKDGNKQGAWSEMQTVTTKTMTTTKKEEIKVDCNKSDWLNMEPFMKDKNNSGLIYLTTDAENLYFLFDKKIGFDPEAIYIDIDPLQGTGYKEDNWLEMGIDYMITGGILYTYIGDGKSWKWNEEGIIVDYLETSDIIEGSIPFNKMKTSPNKDFYITLEGVNGEMLPKPKEIPFNVTQIMKP